MSTIPAEKLDRLRSALKQMKSIALAYSGGVDSTFLLKIAADTLGPENVKAVLAISPTYPQREYDKALKTASIIGVSIEIIQTHEIDDPRFVNNPINRCYFCKQELFAKIADYFGGIKNLVLVDGSNADDLSDYRPGLSALREMGIRSPLQEAGLSKNEIRELSRELELPTWNKDAMACLSSRFPYGEIITLKKLQMIDDAENYLSDLGFGNIRARFAQNTVRLEIDSSQIKRIADDSLRLRILSKMKELGFTYVTLDLEGYRQGSMNQAEHP